ncbi:MAG: T9SS type A sorting domain-containing protein [Flavobacteriales bacterium]|nr:T9SS type A sorting domain-containing protein [Flavobacteriales bacterium]
MKHALLSLALSATMFTNAQTFTTWTASDGLPSSNLRDVAVAADGTIWLATQLGVAHFDGSTFTTHNTTTHPGLADNSISAIAVMANGDVWAGTDVGVSVFNGSSYTSYTTADGLSDNQVNNIKQAPNGDVWIGTINGVTRYSGSTFTAFGSPDIPFGGVTYIAFAANGEVWLGGGLGGVIIYNGSAFSLLTTADGLVSNKIRSIAFDAGQYKWVGTAKGISVFDDANIHIADHTRPFILPAPDTLNPVTDVAIDGQGVLWAAVYVDYLVTEGGISAYDGTWHQYETVDGLAGPNVRRIAIDDNDDVWVTTSTGLTRISGYHVGIAEQAADASFTLFPNPATDQVTIQLASITNGSEVVRILDAQGRVVHSERINTRAVIDVSAFDAGIYFLQVGGGSKRFVIVR